MLCRFVVVFIFVSCVSFGVLAEGVPPTEANITCTKDDPVLKARREEWNRCFNNTVIRHLNPDAPVTGDCHTATAFGEKFETYLQLVNTRCNKNLTSNVTNLIKLIEFSLKNDSFKKFYDNINCVKKFESNISNDCVKAKVGFFNVTVDKKHTSWAAKAKLNYSSASCSTNKDVGNCVVSVLNKGRCTLDTEEYMANLFNYARDLGNCSHFPDTTPAPPLPPRMVDLSKTTEDSRQQSVAFAAA